MLRIVCTEWRFVPLGIFLHNPPSFFRGRLGEDGLMMRNLKKAVKMGENVQ